MSKASELASRLNARSDGPGRWRCACPVHGGKSPSFVIAEGEKQPVVAQCFSHGCSWSDISAWIESNHPDLGVRKQNGQFHIYQGNGYVFRSGDGKAKKIWQETPDKSKLYSLYTSPEFNPDDFEEIFVVEGEKAADAVRALGVENVVTWRGGASSYNKSDWTPLKDKKCYLWPDNDEQGQSAMKALKLILPYSQIVEIPEEIKSIPKSDVADYIALGKFKAEVIATFKNVVKRNKNKKAKLALEDDFFLEAPGLVGEITRELCKYGPQPYPAFAFAAATCVVGALKGSWLRIEGFKLPPTIYAFCFAKTGRGKDFARSQLISVLARAGLSQHITQKLRSDKGLHKDISAGEGVKVILHDEAHHFFQNTDTAGESYLYGVKPLMLELFTAHDKPIYSAGQVIGQKGELKDLLYPTVSYYGLGVPEGLEEAFNARSLSDGFLPRVLLFEAEREVLALEKRRAVPDVFEFESSEKFLQLTKKAKHWITVRSGCLDHPLEFELQKIPITEEANKTFYEYSEQVAKRRNADDIEDMVYSRAVEIAIRLAGALCDDKITDIEAQYSIKLVDAVLGYTKARMGHTMSGEGYQRSQYVLEKLQDFDRGATVRDLTRSCQKIKSSKDIKLILQDLVDAGEVQLIKQKNGSGREVVRFLAC